MPIQRQRAQPLSIHERLYDDAEALPVSTRWHRENGRCTRRDKAAKEQYLSPQEEKGLANYVLRMCQNGYPLPVKVLRSLALVIRQEGRETPERVMKPLGKNWPQGFYKRNLQLKARRLRVMPWDRHEHTIYSKVVQWFSIIGEELADPAILAENVYNMDETGVLLGKLGSLNVLGARELLDPPSLPSNPVCPETTVAANHDVVHVPLCTPTSANGLNRMRGTLDEILDSLSDDEYKLHIQKVVNAAEQSFANCALLADENQSLMLQNNEKKVRQAAKATVPGPAKIMSYEDIVRARRLVAKKKQSRGGTCGHVVGIAKAKAPEASGPGTSTESMRAGEAVEHGDVVQVVETQNVDIWLPPCPGRAPVARMWVEDREVPSLTIL